MLCPVLDAGNKAMTKREKILSLEYIVHIMWIRTKQYTYKQANTEYNR
jgi:hypothetical protein